MEGCKSITLKHSTTAPGFMSVLAWTMGISCPSGLKVHLFRLPKLPSVYCRKPITIVEGIKVTLQSQRGCFQHMGCIDAYLRELALS
jgi:hypothetical protein